MKEKILLLREQGLKDPTIAKIVGLTRQRVHQIRTGYKPPLVEPSKIKILTKRKREWMGMSEEEYRESLVKTLPIEEIRILNERKRMYLSIPTGKVDNLSGGRDYRRELVRMRDGHTCQICRKKWEPNTRKFDVHHKDEDSKKTRQFDSIEEFPNMVTLCHSCHLKLHYGKIDNPFV